MLRDAIDISSVPFRGGAITVREKASLPFGAFSMVRNMRGEHPGFKKRKGQRKFHSTADGTNKVLSLYQMEKNRISESHFFAQMDDGDILESSNDPPDVITGAFGDEIFSGSSGQIPASWAVLDDIMVHSNGVDQHKLYAGKDNYVEKFVVYKETSAAPDIPEHGYDYTEEVTDGQTDTAAVLDAFGSDSDHSVFICTPIPINRLTWTFGNSKPNSTAATGTLSYRKSDGSWADTTETDGTISSGATLGQTGSMTWTPPSDEIPWYMYGVNGFWYRWQTGTELDGEVEVTKVTYGTDHDASGTRTSFVDLVSIWDGIPTPAVEVRVEHDGEVYTFASGNVNLGGLDTNAFDENDAMYIASADPLMGVYCDPGSTPSVGDSTSIDAAYYWNGTAWAALTDLTDNTDGLVKAGWVTWARAGATPQPLQMDGGGIYAYWYKLEVDDQVGDDVVVSVDTMPYFDIDEFGKGQCCCTWQDSMAYSFTLYPQYVYITDKNRPCVLEGVHAGALEAGDGRTNKVVAMRKFHNELMVWQEEKGVEGGCLTLFEGDEKQNYGKLLISDRLGTFNNNSVVVVDGVLTSTATDEKVKTLAFFLSNSGLCASDGQTVTIVSDDFQNYFNPTESECITRGQEDNHWLAYDGAENVLRMGLVTGTGATAPNVFPVFDLTDKVVYFDDPAQELSCMVEVSGGSGDVKKVQMAGGTDDGTVYQLNYGTADVSTAIDDYVVIELDGKGEVMVLREIALRCLAQTGNITLTPSINDIDQSTITLSMAAEITNQKFRRHRFGVNIVDQHISLKFQNNSDTNSMSLIDWGTTLFIWGGV